MGTKRVLVTGGAGFIGSHLVDALIARGHQVRVLDALVAQVHGLGASRPEHLHPDAEFIQASVLSEEFIERALQAVDVVFHQAAEVGIGQSMYEIVKYVEANTLGTAVLLQALASGRHRVEKLVVASSMSLYGEGGYVCECCGPIFPRLRERAQLQAHDWELHCPACQAPARPALTSEDKPLYPSSVYAISKLDQELLCLTVGRAYQIPTVALRYFNTYGPRQALGNPYTGVAAIFSSRLLNGQPPLVFEDGRQSRDFIHVRDIVQANLLAMERPEADFEVFNVGTGRPTTVLEVAETLARGLGVDLPAQVVGAYREGDIRHCVADIARIQAKLGYRPTVAFEEGMADLLAWVKAEQATAAQPAKPDGVSQATDELKRRGLIVT